MNLFVVGLELVVSKCFFATGKASKTFNLINLTFNLFSVEFDGVVLVNECGSLTFAKQICFKSRGDCFSCH